MKGFRAISADSYRENESASLLYENVVDLDQGQLQSPSFAAKFTHSVIPEVGPIPNFTTSGESGSRNVTDFNGVIRELGVNEAGFVGARRVFNLLRSTEYLSNGGSRTDWTVDGSAVVLEITDDSTLYDNDGTFSVFRLTDGSSASSRLWQGVGTPAARRHTISSYMRSGTASTARLQLYVSGGALTIDQPVTLTTSWQRFCFSGVPDGTSAYRFGIVVGTLAGTNEGTIYVKNPQVEDTSGLPVDVCSEYVSRDVLPTSPYHGTCQDGSQCFDTVQGNTANGSGLVTEETGAAISASILKGLNLHQTAQNKVLNNETLTAWTKTDATSVITDSNTTSPRQDTTATKLDEGTGAATSHLFSYSLPGASGVANNANVVFSIYLKDSGVSTGRQWARIGVLQMDAATRINAYFDIRNGVIGTVTSGGYAYMETLKDKDEVATGWYRCSIRCLAGSSGASQPVVQIGPAEADNDVTYTGTNKYIYAWQPTFGIGYNVYPGTFTGAAVGTQPRTSFEVNARGVLDVNNFAVAMSWTPFFDSADQPTGINEGTIWATRVNPVDALNVYERMGMRCRRRDGKLVLDRYLGDPYYLYVWAANTAYAVGDHVIKTTTKPDNSNGTMWFTCMQAGTSGGSEPTWDNTYVPVPDTTTDITTDGTVKWQANAPVQIEEPGVGNYEPYDVHRIVLTYTYNNPVKLFWWANRSPDMGFAADGAKSSLETIEFPIDRALGDMPHQPTMIEFCKGGFGYATYNQCIKNVYMWNRVVSSGAGIGSTA